VPPCLHPPAGQGISRLGTVNLWRRTVASRSGRMTGPNNSVWTSASGGPYFMNGGNNRVGALEHDDVPTVRNNDLFTAC